jgi:hypothetical protein
MIKSNDASSCLHIKLVYTKFIFVIALAVLAIAIGVGAFASLVNRPPEASTEGGNPSSPVLLVHGLGEDASIWKKWGELLTNDGIQSLSKNLMTNVELL